MTILRSLILDWCPPRLLRIVMGLRVRQTHFRGPFVTWEDALANCSGYNAANILDCVLDASLQVKHGIAAFERDSVTFKEIEYSWPALAALMWAAAKDHGILNVLDYGGALGSSYYQNISFLKSLEKVNWSIVEQPSFVEVGKKYFEGPELSFHMSIEEYSRLCNPNVIYLSSVLQYIPDLSGTIAKLVDLNADTIIVDRTIINHSAINTIYIQVVPSSIYSASYPVRSLSKTALIDLLSPKYLLKASFSSLPFPELSKIDSVFHGFIFTKAE